MARSLKTNYLLLALGVSAVLLLILSGLAYYEHRVNTSDANQLTYATVEQKLETDLEARAASLSNTTSSALGLVTRKEGNSAAIALIAGRLLDERDVVRVEVTDARNNILFSGSNPAARQSDSGPLVMQRDLQNGGSLKIWMSRAEVQDTLSSVRAQLLSKQGMQAKRIRGALAGLALPLFILGGLLGAWFIASRISGPISALVKSADRIGEGDYTRPLAVQRHDELGDLQFALERMRQNLNETTITKNYLNTVLNSLSDSVFVTSPDGLVKSCNEAAQHLLGYTEAELLGKPLIGFIDEVHRSAFDMTNSAPLRHPDENAESHAVPASAAAGHSARAAQSALAGALVPGLGPVQGGQ
jgi:PAS domain-containing protein